MDALSISAEALVAVTGVMPDQPLTAQTARAARELPKRWAQLVGAFFSEETWRPFKMPDAPDYEATYDALAEGLGAEERTRLLPQVRDELLADAYVAQLEQARAYLFERWPINQLDTATGPKNLPPSTMQQGQATALWSVVNDPTQVLEEMLMGTLLEEQAAAVRDVYPGLFSRLRTLIDVEIKERQARSEKYTVPWERERVLRCLLGLPQETPIVEAPKGGGGGGDAPAQPAPEIDIDFARERPRVVDRAA